MEITKKIGDMVRTVTIESFDWGVTTSCVDESKNLPNKVCQARCFSYTKKCSTLSDLVEKVKMFYKLEDKVVKEKTIWKVLITCGNQEEINASVNKEFSTKKAAIQWCKNNELNQLYPLKCVMRKEDWETERERHEIIVLHCY